jgi:molybdenum cofactor biosynthesis protein B
MKPEHERPVRISAAIITVSTTRNRETDTSGRAIRELLQAAGIEVEYYAIVKDEQEGIRREVLNALKECNCIILNGGTGLTHDDCTIEAIMPLLEKKIDGFGEIFRAKSVQEIGTSAMLSRAIAGICNGKVIFCIPGSTAAVTLATRDLILPEMRHILTHAN